MNCEELPLSDIQRFMSIAMTHLTIECQKNPEDVGLKRLKNDLGRLMWRLHTIEMKKRQKE